MELGLGAKSEDLPCVEEMGRALGMVEADMEGGGVFLVGGDALLLRRRLTIQTMAETLRASKAVATSTMMTTQRPGSLEASLPTLEEGTGVGGASPAWVEGEKARVTPEHAQTLHSGVGVRYGGLSDVLHLQYTQWATFPPPSLQHPFIYGHYFFWPYVTCIRQKKKKAVNLSRPIWCI